MKKAHKAKLGTQIFNKFLFYYNINMITMVISFVVLVLLGNTEELVLEFFHPLIP